jgi:ribokinase
MVNMDRRKARIAVVGSYAVGMTISCARFPGEGETVTGRNFSTLHGGKGSNQAIAAARMGGAVAFGSAIGADPFGDEALAMLQKEGVDTAFVTRKPDHATGVGLIMVSDSGSNEIVIDLGANEALAVADVERMRTVIAGSDFLLVQLEANLEAVVHAVGIAHEARVPVILNPAPFRLLPAQVLAQVSYLTPNETEAAALLGLTDSQADGQTLAGRLHQAYGNAVIVTLGDKGAHVCTRDLDCRVPGFPARCVDTTGAGDTFSGALAVALGEGLNLLEAVGFANMAASISVEREGVVPSIPYRQQVDARLEPLSRRAR